MSNLQITRITSLNEEDSNFESISSLYCRCCFFIFTPKCNKNQINDNFVLNVRKVFNFLIKFKPGVSWMICDKCKDTVNEFNKIKTEFVEKQVKFGDVISRNFTQDLDKIRTISINATPLFDRRTRKYAIKSQALSAQKEEIIEQEEFLQQELVLIKEEPLEPPVLSSVFILKQEPAKRKPRHIRITKKKAQNLRKNEKIQQLLKKIHRGEKNIFCDLCGYSTNLKFSVELHIRNNHLPKEVGCLHCDYKTFSNERIKIHVRNVHEVKVPDEKLFCHDCKRIFRGKSSLNSHMDRYHKRAAPKFKCKRLECEKIFLTMTEMTNHFMNSHGPKNFICDFCAARFGSFAMLKSHLLSHEELRFSCHICGKKFERNHILKTHIKRSHMGVKDNKCHLCEAAYFFQRDLNNHIAAKHLGLRFKCEVAGCKSSLSRRDAYFNHLKSHKELTSEEIKELHEKADKFCKENKLRK